MIKRIRAAVRAAIRIIFYGESNEIWSIGYCKCGSLRVSEEEIEGEDEESIVCARCGNRDKMPDGFHFCVIAAPRALKKAECSGFEDRLKKGEL